jgi:hypothetical protein
MKTQKIFNLITCLVMSVAMFMRICWPSLFTPNVDRIIAIVETFIIYEYALYELRR